MIAWHPITCAALPLQLLVAPTTAPTCQTTFGACWRGRRLAVFWRWGSSALLQLRWRLDSDRCGHLPAHRNTGHACKVFGSGGREARPPEGVLKGFTTCAGKTAEIINSVKTVANTDYAIGPHG